MVLSQIFPCYGECAWHRDAYGHDSSFCCDRKAGVLSCFEFDIIEFIANICNCISLRFREEQDEIKSIKYMIYLTRKFEFSASHRIYDPSLSNEDNYKLFGKCSNPNGHGHNYVLEVTVSGEINPGTGYIIDIKDIKTIVNREIIDKVDHKNLNIDVEFMSGVIPTTENIVFKFWKVIVDKINSDNRKLYSLKLFETPNNSVEYRGEIYG